MMSAAIEFLRELPRMTSQGEVGSRYVAMARPYGFTAAACGGARLTPTGLVHEFFFNTWPKDMIDAYVERDYVRHDVGPLQARLTAMPFTWQEAIAGRLLNAKQKQVVEWGLSVGVIDGFGVPIHYPGGDFGFMVTLADHTVTDLAERVALQMASFYTHHRCLEIGCAIEASSVRNPLTAREVQCIRMVLQGKSDRSIADELGISPTTARFHVDRVKTKLGVKTRAQAASLIFQLGYV